MPRACFALAVLFVAFVVGCSAEDDQPTAGSDRVPAELEAALERLVGAGPAAFCDLQTSRQLTDSFGKRDPLERCHEIAERRGGGSPVEAFEVVEVKEDCARVDAEDQRGTKAVLFMREIDGQWLLDNIEAPPVSGSVNVCGTVRIFEDEESE